MKSLFLVLSLIGTTLYADNIELIYVPWSNVLNVRVPAGNYVLSTNPLRVLRPRTGNYLRVGVTRDCGAASISKLTLYSINENNQLVALAMSKYPLITETSLEGEARFYFEYNNKSPMVVDYIGINVYNPGLHSCEVRFSVTDRKQAGPNPTPNPTPVPTPNPSPTPGPSPFPPPPGF